jgi:hypothetical protein
VYEYTVHILKNFNPKGELKQRYEKRMGGGEGGGFLRSTDISPSIYFMWAGGDFCARIGEYRREHERCRNTRERKRSEFCRAMAVRKAGSRK